MKKTFSEINNNLIFGNKSNRIFKNSLIPKLTTYISNSSWVVFEPLKHLINTVNHYKQTKGCVKISETNRFFSLQYLDYFVNYGDVPLEMALSFYSDIESKDSVKKLLRNWKLCATNNFIKEDVIFTEKDKQKISQQKLLIKKEKKENRKFLIFAGLRFYKPISFLPEVFIEKCGINYIEKKDSITSGSFIVDCGAYVGDSSVMFADNFKTVNIIAIEMVPKNVEHLKKNIELNKLSDKIFIQNNAIGDKKRDVNFSGNGLMANQNSNGEETICQTTLDEIVKKKTVSIIKMDIEGAELSALKGAEKTIKRDKPILLISIYHNPSHLIEIPEYIKSICPEYKFKIRHLKPESPCIDYMLICET